MNKGVFYIIIMFAAAILCSCTNSSTNEGNINSNENYLIQDSDAINLNDLSGPLNIPMSKRTITLARGSYIYTYTKKAVLSDKKYIVAMTDMLSYTPAHKASPDDAYSRTLEIVPANDQSAVRAIKNFKSGQWQIKTKKDMAQAKQIIADSNHLNSAKFSIGIIPADNSIKALSKIIKESDTITVSGVQYKLASITNKGQKEPITYCLSMDVFYLTDLEID